LHRTFSLGARQVEALTKRGEPLVLTPAAEAGRRIGGMEDRLLLQGHAGARVHGLLEHDGAVALGLGDWSDPGRAADELLGALVRLDDAGRHGPYAVALSPARYYQLLRPYAGGALTPYQQLLPAFAAGIVKAPALADGALVVERSEAGPKVVVGQELAAAYDGREGIFHLISLVESVTLLPGAPGSVAVLRPGR
ncbi:MAG TPA: family 1 encapsulin nanocompartment shell protein, partial [Anaeromyxobacteraceae bacterium]|nr:family 1 encapsulin nanocompartment shell protein [Anaeromyxobacteraceae bacterium]